MSQIDKKDLVSLMRSFKYAFNGFIFCINNERNMRIHVSVSALVILFGIFFGLTRMEWTVLFITFSIVIVTEMINTSIEAVVNLKSPSYHTLAKISKDVAAAAVLVAAFMSFIIGILIFSDLDRLIPAIVTIATSAYWTPLFIVAIASAVLFIFKGYKIIYRFFIKKK